MDCPKCIGKLQAVPIAVFKAHDIKELEGAGAKFTLEVDQCFACRGVWFDKGELDKYLSEQMESVNSPSLGGETDKEFNSKTGNCPLCSIELVKKTAEGDAAVTVDSCGKCGGLWLDSTEIDKLEKSNPLKTGKRSFVESLILSVLNFRKKK